MGFKDEIDANPDKSHSAGNSGYYAAQRNEAAHLFADSVNALAGKEIIIVSDGEHLRTPYQEGVLEVTPWAVSYHPDFEEDD